MTPKYLLIHFYFLKCMANRNVPALFQEASEKKKKENYESVITNAVTIVHLLPFDLI